MMLVSGKKQADEGMLSQLRQSVEWYHNLGSANPSSMSKEDVAKFGEWIKIVYIPWKEEKAILIYSTLANHLVPDELVDLLASDLFRDKKVLVEQLLDIQVQSSKIRKLSDNAVFTLLRLDKMDGNLLFGSLAFSQWVSFVTNGAEFPSITAYKSMYSICSTRFAGNWDLLLAENPSYTSFAVHQLRVIQLKEWERNMKSYDDVFSILGLSDDVYVSKRSSWKTWLSYLYFCNQNSASKVLGILREKFGDAKTAGTLCDGLWFSSGHRVTQLREAQYDDWIAHGLDPVYVWLKIIHPATFDTYVKRQVVQGYRKYYTARLHGAQSSP